MLCFYFYHFKLGQSRDFFLLLATYNFLFFSVLTGSSPLLVQDLN